MSFKQTTGVLAVGAVGGAVAAWFLDPERGARRRHVLRDRAVSLGRRSARRMRQRAEYAGGVAQGLKHRAASVAGGPPREYDDVTLARKVETELFRPVDVPKGSISVNAHDGVVELRGAVKPEQIPELGAAAERVAGVRRVENLLHAPGSPAKHSPVSDPAEVRERAAKPKAESRFSHNPATTPPADEPFADRAPAPGQNP